MYGIKYFVMRICVYGIMVIYLSHNILSFMHMLVLCIIMSIILGANT